MFQIRPTPGNSTVDFDELVRAASEIAVAKENCFESANTSVCGVSGSSGEKSKKKLCGNCNTKNHNEAGFSEEARKNYCKAYGVECGKCRKKHHFTDACKTGNWKQKKDNKKAKVNVVNTVDTVAPDTSAVSVVSTSTAGPAGPVAALISVQQEARRAEYTFDPERYSEASNNNGSYWAVTSSIPIQIQRLWSQSKMEEARVESSSVARQPIGHYIFDNESP